MMKMTLLAIAALLFAHVGASGAREVVKKKEVKGVSDDPAIQAAIEVLLKEKDKKPFEKHDASKLDEALRDVINEGRKMFNEQGDHAGCYRLFQGSLMAVRPFLAKDLQARIDGGIAKAEKMPSYADRAWELRRVLDDVRASTKGGSGKAQDVGDKGQLTGKVTFDGKPLAGGYFVTLVGADGKKFSSAIQKDGSVQFKTPIPVGQYRVVIEPVPGDSKRSLIPARYAAEGTSGIVIMVQAGKNQVDWNLPR